MTLRRAAPWIVSLLAHAGLVLLVPLGADLRAMQTPVAERRVVLQLDDAPPEPPTASAPEAPSITASAIQMPASLPLPSAVALDPVAEELRAASARIVTVPGGIPSAREVLDALPPPPGPLATAAARSDAAAAEPALRIGWAGAARTVVRSVNPRFPAILSERGQEAVVDARITVTPLGAVVDVEITRSSGYTEIDAAVETALRQWIFSRSEGKQNALGTVSYRFPLERRD
jgi:TonB family protein